MKTSTCQHCSTLFTVTPGSYGKFCSLSCGTTFRNKINLEKAEAKYKLTPTRCKCCDSTLSYEKRKNKFCSNSCSSKITNQIARKRGPTAIEKLPYSKIKFILCKHTNQYYSNKYPDGSNRRCSPYVKTLKEQYYAAARFKFNVYHYPEEFDLSLIEQYGWYTCPGLKRKGQLKNTLGVSRDHIISVSYGFANNISPNIISHPANCRIMLHVDNKIKHSACDMTISQLLARIEIWNKKYTERNIRIELMTEDWKSAVLPLN